MRPLLALILLATVVRPSFAASIERLVMPGELIQGHAKYEEQCERCHAKFEKRGQNMLCRSCHEAVDADIAVGRGFHGKMANAASAACKGCHTDHKGRGADIVPLDRETFPHARTDFPLKGAHARTGCTACHQRDLKWREAPGECVECHRDDDSHQGRLGKQCADCHAPAGWAKGRFDHDSTRFPLKGEHGQVLCVSCHPGQRYKETPKECVACHRINDIHSGRYGTECADCHQPEAWDRPRFDHDQTKFPLRHKHRKVSCTACHPGNLYKDKAPLACDGCHQYDDIHRGKNGPKCDACHDARGWQEARFDHTAKTRFPLRGGHTDLRCESCHKGDLYEVKLETTCYSCHRADDPHRGSEGKQCESCHRQTSWGEEIRFDHDLGRFPLIGLHATAPCEACHLTAAYKETAKECARCHRGDDKHDQRLGTACAECHSPNGWALWEFDHDTRTDYPLTGKHAGLDCLSCHREPMEHRVALSSACDGCHRKDDVHLGRFGTQCQRCHTTESFPEITLRP